MEVPEADHVKYKKEDAIDHAAMQRYMDTIYGKFQRYATAKQIAQDWSKFVHFLEHYKPGTQLPEYKEQAGLNAQERNKHDAALVEHAQTTIAQLQDPVAAQKLFDQTCKLKPADYSTEDAYVNALLARFKTCMNLRQKQKELRNKTA